MGLTDEFIRTDEKYGAHNYHPLPVVLSKAEGPWVWDVEGKKYLDCLSAYSAVNQGHRHPKIVQALKDQLDRLDLTSRAFHNDMMGVFLKKLCDYTGFSSALPMNTGAEAVETGIKAARRWAYRKKGVKKDQAEIIVCSDNFHGRTTTIVGFSTDPDANDGYGPFTPGFKIIPFNDPAALEEAITENTAAFMVEPIQGEAGVIVPDKGYLSEVRRICTKNEVLFVLDEVQTGFCRTGKRFCWMHEGARPDIMQVGKALGGGVYPVSGIVADRSIMDVFTPGSHGSTFGGNPLASAVGMAALSVLEDERLDEKASQNGKHFMDILSRMPEERIREVRGKGLLVGVELQVSAGKARPYCLKLKEEGILAKDTHAQTIRFAPPLITERSVLEDAAGTIMKVLVP
jgi:ornithine--oxo-acid transaminase